MGSGAGLGSLSLLSGAGFGAWGGALVIAWRRGPALSIRGGWVLCPEGPGLAGTPRAGLSGLV